MDLRSDRLTARQAIAIFAAGPAAEIAYWTLVVVTGVLAPVAIIVRIVLIAGIFNLANAVAGFFSRKEGSDGQMIRHLRTLPAKLPIHFGAPPASTSAARSVDSVAPPGYAGP